MPINAIQPTDGLSRAKDFVNANPNKIAHRAYKHYQEDNREKTEKFNNRVDFAIKSLPVIAVASSLALGKSAKSAAKSGAMWGVALAAPAIVSGINNVVAKSSRPVRKAERKHQGLTLAGLVGASIAAMEVGFRGLEKLAGNKTVNRVADTVVSGAKNTFSKVKSDVKFIDKFVDKGAEVISKAAEHAPAFIKGSAAKKVVAAAPAIVGFAALGAVVAHGIGQINKYSGIKSDVKAKQFDVAKDIVNAYDTENQSLKAENDALKSVLAEKAEADATEEA